MKNEFSIGQHFKFMTYVVPHSRDENLNKVKIEMETGNLVSIKNESVNRAPQTKTPINNPMVSLNIALPNTPTQVKQEALDKPSSNPNPNKLLVNTKQSNLLFNSEIKREEQCNPVNFDPSPNIKKIENKFLPQEILVDENKHQINEVERTKIKKRKREIKENIDNITSEGDIRTGRWSKEEHRKFIEAICKFGNEWKKVQQYIKSRSSTQARSHAQKFFLRLKKKFNLSNKDSETSIAELSKLPEDVIINYIRECTNTDTNINIEEKDRLINVLVNFANFNKKNKRRKRKNSMEKDEILSQPSNIKMDNNILTPKNPDYKDDFFSNEDNNLSINNLMMSEENDEEIEDTVTKSKKIFKISKEPKVSNTSISKSQLNNAVSINTNTSNNHQSSLNNSISTIQNSTNPPAIKNIFKEPLVVKEEIPIQQEKPNTISVPFNIKIENTVPKTNFLVNQSEPVKNQIGIVGEPNNKQNYNYINIMTINLCPPNLVNGTQNKQIVHQSQIPINTLLSNLNNNNDATSQKIRNQLLQHLISNNLVNIKTIPNISNNNNNCNTINRNNLINQFQNNLNNNLSNNINISNNISQKPAGINPVLNSSNSAYNSFIKTELIQNNVNIGVGSNSQNVINNSRLGNNNTNNTVSNTNNNLNNNKFLNNINNLNFLNTSNQSNHSFNSGKYDEIKNYYNSFSKTNSGNSLNNSNSLRNSSFFSNSYSTLDLSNEKLKQKSKNNTKIQNNKVSHIAMREFLMNQANQTNNSSQINNKLCSKNNVTSNIKQVSLFNLRNL